MCSELKAYVLCRKHAHVDLVSEMDVTKALRLNGEVVLDKPIKVEKAKIKIAEKVKLSAEDKKGIEVTVLDLLHVHEKYLMAANSWLFPVYSNKKQQMFVSEKCSLWYYKRTPFENLQSFGC